MNGTTIFDELLITMNISNVKKKKRKLQNARQLLQRKLTKHLAVKIQEKTAHSAKSDLGSAFLTKNDVHTINTLGVNRFPEAVVAYWV